MRDYKFRVWDGKKKVFLNDAFIRDNKCSVDALRRNCVTPTTRQVFGTDYRREKMICPTCEGDGIERCDNPDHGFIQALGFTDMGRIGCPCCGHDEKHRIIGCKCPDCNGTGVVEGAKNTEQLDQAD